MTDPVAGAGLTLAMNAAEGAVQIVFGDRDGKLIYGQWIRAASRGAEILTPAIEAALSLLEKKPRDISRVAVVRGPGSFTGLRLTAATAAGLARAVTVSQAGIDYMHLLARQGLPFAPPAPEAAHLWSIVRARRDLVYMQAFVREREGVPPMRPVTGLSVKNVSSGDAVRHILDSALSHRTSRVLLCGSGARENRDAFEAGLAVPGAPQVTMLEIEGATSDTLLAAACGAPYAHADIEPLYVRVSDAEANLPQIAGRLGLDPGEAAAKLHELTHAGPGDATTG